MSSLKQNLALGLCAAVIAAVVYVGVVLLGLAINTSLIAVAFFIFNAAFHWCGGWAYVGVWKTLSYSFLIAAGIYAIRVFKSLVVD